MKIQVNTVSRREFMTTAALSAAALFAGAPRIYADGTETIRVALVGCGGRGKGALENFLEAARFLGITVEITALADYFHDRAVEAAQKFNIPGDRCIAGVDAYQKAVATNADVILLVTPPVFRPVHLRAAVEAGKHVFMEKPVAVDPVGARTVIETGELAKTKGLSIVTGTQRRHQVSYLQTKQIIDAGAIGPILSGQVWWCQNKLWHKTRQPGECDADYLVRNWVSFCEMSGDHIVEQHFHNLDVANWFIGKPPKQCIGFGGRARRRTGNQFDFFSVDYDYGNGVHVHSMSRQIDQCYSRVAESFTAAQGTAAGSGPVRDREGKAIPLPDLKGHENPYVQEHIDLLESIRGGRGDNDTLAAAQSNLTAIMGRISAYTGQLVRWSDVAGPQSASPWYTLALKPSPLDFETGTVKTPKDDECPVPGAYIEDKTEG